MLQAMMKIIWRYALENLLLRHAAEEGCVLLGCAKMQGSAIFIAPCSRRRSAHREPSLC